MSLPPLPDKTSIYVVIPEGVTLLEFLGYKSNQMCEYGQQCYEQALLDAMNATRAFGKDGKEIACAIRGLK